MKATVSHRCAGCRAKPTKGAMHFVAATVVGCGIYVSLSGAASADNTGFRGGGNVPRAEVLQLPQFCWARYMKELQSTEYRISYSSCGPNTNHYCDALLYYNRAMKAAPGSKERASQLRVARGGVVYTLGGIEGRDACPIREHVQTTLRTIDAMLLGQGTNAKR